MEAMQLPVYNSEGKEIEKVELAKDVFGARPHSDSLYQAIVAYNANQRKGLAATKTRGEVSGGGRKPWKQKGTGRARAGSTRSPLWRHGGVVFGPHPRDFSYHLPDKLKKLALRSAVASKLDGGNIVVLDNLLLVKPNTKEAAKVFNNLKIGLKKDKKESVLLLLDKCDEGLLKALRNLSYLDISLARCTNAYEVLAHRKIVFTSPALEEFTKRLQK